MYIQCTLSRVSTSTGTKSPVQSEMGDDDDARDDDAGGRPWRGVLVEADPERFRELSALHGPLGNVCLCRCVSCAEDSPDALPAVLRDAQCPRVVDFVSIDVDGADYWLFHDLLLRSDAFAPRVVCVEFNPTIPDDVLSTK